MERPVLSILPLAFVLHAAASEPGSFQRSLAVTGPVSLDISSGPGGVVVTTGTSKAVVVHAVIRAAFGRADLGLAEANIKALEQDPPVEQSGNNIRIGYVKSDTILKGVSVTYEIQTPPEPQVHAVADAGGIRVTGVQGPVETINDAGRSEVDGVSGTLKMTTRSGGLFVRDAGSNVVLRNGSGGIQLEGASGSVEAETDSGRIEISGVSQSIHATTQSASIRLHDNAGAAKATNRSGSIESLSSSGALQAETVSGSISISQTSPAPVQAVSRSGAIHVELAAGKGYSLHLRSDKGKISAPGAEPQAKDQHALDTQIHGGGPLISVETRSSKIEVE